MSVSRKDFPEGFEFGVATAAYQIEGTRNGIVGPSHWDSYAATLGNVVNGENGDVACDHYHRYGEDLDLVRDGNFDTYRFSTAWTRVMPDGRTVNADGLAFYDRLVDAVLERGLKPSLTLYHWELPEVFADAGGWSNRDTALAFGDYARAVMDRLGDRVGAVATINEPWCIAWLSHFLGLHAPGMRNIRTATRAMHHINLAHAEGMQAIRASGSKADAGIVLNFAWPKPESDADAKAARRFDGIHNRWFLEAITKGQYPADTLDGLGPYMPDGWQDDMAAISAPIDWLGVNYYTRTTLRDLPGAVWPAFEDVPGPLPKTDMGWEIYPDGLGDMLTRIARDYTGDTPIIVTENGMAGDDHLDGQTCDDPVRVQYFDDHLQSVLRSIKQGTPVRGYYAWSLLDNYEWSFGYDKRFGIVYVDYATQARYPKASYHALKDAIG
ncbi:beta-glucosidase [Maribius pontilimi]|uniref:Beta-glucosidase n=1 Tax=Palleronia pontilimi TaxID=1964209 RepID=A0A934ILI9_9RHOB|nr:GH1 family beta-glucosidase [Palleronia pontilimi]MBJ3764234.1 beta-glucosidase [Palleronia pontilimi]